MIRFLNRRPFERGCELRVVLSEALARAYDFPHQRDSTGLKSSTPLSDLLEEQPHIHRMARRLVSDASDADDLEQRAWLSALRAPPRHSGGLRSWFRTKVRNLAINESEARRRRLDRETFGHASRAPHTPEEIAHRREIVAQLASALDRLDERYSAVLRLRYYDELSPAEIAERMGLPVETVHTRLRRGIARMRTSLDGKFGDRSVWSGVLLGWLASGSMDRRAPIAATGTLNVLGLLTGSLAAASIVMAWLFVGDRGASSALLLPGGTDVGTLEESPDLLPIPSTVPPRSSEMSPRTDTPMGHLEAYAVDPANERPVADLRLRIVRLGPGEARVDSSLLDRSARRTNAQGACSWSELETGVWEVVPERGSPAQVTVSAGKGASVEIRVPAGVAIQVGVLDVRGHAVPRASILVSEPGSLSGWRTVGQSDEAGRIELVGMDPRSWVAARADGFRPAQARLVGDSDAVGLVFLVLHESRAFQGRVLDEAGDPVVGARLEVMRELESGIWIERTGELSASWERSSARTDALGRFELDGVLQRELDLRIEAAGFEESVESIHLIVTRFAPMDFTLVRRQEPAPRFEWGGVVRGADGLPLSGALVFARPRLGVNRSPLSCLADAPDTRRIVTDEHGRFTFEDSSARPQDLWVVDRGGVSRFPCAHLAAAPSSSSVEIVSVGEPQGVLSGILDPNLAGEILLMLGSRALIGPIELPVDPDTRAFRVEGLPAADYSLALFFQGELYRDALRFQLASGAHLELGRVTLPALGRVRIQVLREDDASLEGTWAALVGERGITLRVRYGATARGAAYGRDGFLTFDGLPCGPHTIHFGGQGLAQSACLVDVRPGVPETVAMTVGAGVAVLFELRDPGEPLGSVVLDLVDATDRMVARHSVDSRADEALIMLRLAPGPYRVIVRRESGRTTEHPVVVPASQGERLVIDFGHGQGSGSSTR